MSQQKTHVASLAFSVTGEYITDHARLMVQSNKWREALDLLVEDCENMTHEIALSILRGEKTLTGCTSEGGLGLADEDQTRQEVQAYLSTVAYQYGALWAHNGKVYRPWAKVAAYSQADLDWAGERFAPMWNSRRSMQVPFCVLRGRVLYYAPNEDGYIATLDMRGVSKYMTVDDIDTDYVHPGIRGGYVWECVGDYPMWIKPHKTCEQALKAALEGGRHLRVIDNSDTGAPAECTSNIEETVVVEDAEKDVAAKARYEARLARRDQEEAERKKKRQVAIQRIRDEILAQVGSDDDADWIRIPVCKSLGDFRYEEQPYKYLRVPYLPFVTWVLNRSPWRKIDPNLIKDWKTVSPIGLKMINDDPVHSDWVIGAGIDPEDFYNDEELNTATYKMRGQLLDTMLNYEIEVFSGTGRVYGNAKLLKPGEALTSSDHIGIIPNGGMEYDAALRSAVKHDTAIIMQVGGKLCHAAIVARETGLRLAMWSKAGELQFGERICLDLTNRTIDVGQT